RLMDAGNIVHANDQNGVVVVTQLQPIAVLFTIPEDNLPPVMKKLTAGEDLKTDAYDRSDQHRIASGSLLTVDNQIDQSTGTVRLKAVFQNDDGALFPNQFVNVHLLLDVKHAAIMLAGAIAYHELPVSALPQVDYPTIQVLTFYPGAGPDVMASSVTAPLERQFGQMPGLKEMLSTSSFGSSVITLQFTLELNL